MTGWNHKDRISGLPVLGAAALLACLPAHADTPLSLVVTQDLTYDSNILRDNNRKYRDAISATGARVGFDKEYGRQTYKASVTGVAKRYKNTKDYNTEDFSANLGLTSTLMSNWYVSFDADASKQQQRPEDQGNLRYNETINANSMRLFAQYGMFGRWSVNASYDFSKANYKERDFYDRESKSVRLGVKYSPTDLLSFDWGVSKSKVDSPKYPLLGKNDAIIYGDPVDRYDVDLSTRWIVTGFSSLNSRIAWTREKHANDPRRDYIGLTGRLAWNYTPAGKLSYNLAVDRDTNNAGGGAYREFIDLGSLGVASTGAYAAQNRISTSLSATVNWQVTAKVGFNSGFTYKRIKEERNEVVPGLNRNDNSSLNGDYKSLRLGVKYSLARSASLGCSVEKYDRSRSLFGAEYDGESVNCNVTFVID